MQTGYDSVIAAYDGLSIGGRDFWKGYCPRPGCAGKRRRTLYFWVGRQGQLMIRCWRCGRMNGEESKAFLQDVLAQRGFTILDLFPFDEDRRRPVEAGRPRPVATYVYEDFAGNPAHRTTRYEFTDGHKSFSQDRWDAEQNKWRAGLQPHPQFPRYLFRTPQLIDKRRTAELVLIVEGEKKVLALEEWGFLATCNVGGCGMGWLNEYSAVLIGRRVAVLPDQDSSGQRHAETVVGSLLRHGAASIQIVQLPELRDKEDIVDWQKTHPVGDFIQVVRNTPTWTSHKT